MIGHVVINAGIEIKQGRGGKQVCATANRMGTTRWEVTLELRAAGGERGAGEVDGPEVMEER